ncbi:MAG: family 1 glycosylhydrolase [Halanaerobiales bacterium]|nr:family 1 glycosylhydrolase [Halanaerobiales bacterium]
MVLKLDQDLLLGSATAPYQIEGGIINSDWHKWCQLPGNISDGTSGEIACDHWNRIEEDSELLKKMNHQIYRLGIEWGRVQPRAEAFDDDALDRYRYELQLLRDKGIRPLVTLHHFVNPEWLMDIGGWEKSDIADRFSRYVRYVVDGLADLVDEWITINEPFVYVVHGYAYGIWPPGKKEPFTGFKVLKNMLHAHVQAYQVIHQIYKDRDLPVKVGISHHMRNFDPINQKNPLDRMSARIADRLNNKLVLEAMINGQLILPLGTGQPWGVGPFCDFIGLNYYSRDLIKFSINPKDTFMKRITNSTNETSDLGWEIYPDGLYRILKELGQHGMPIYITENGIANEDDSKRSAFILKHLQMIQKARDEGIPVERYYHWSTMDNFEWAEGLSSRFGLVEVNYKTLERKIRSSGKMYAELCKTHIITDDLLEKYAPGLEI